MTTSQPYPLLTAWSWDPTVLAMLALTGAMYALGSYRLSHRSRYRGGLRPWRTWCFSSGLLMLGVALLSPIDTFDGELFSLHMAQHLLLLLVIPPLLWLGAPLVPMLWALPASERSVVGRLVGRRGHLHRVLHVLTNPLLAATLFVGGMLLWHVPRFYDAAQARTMVHDLEHLTFLGTGLLYWWPVIHPTGGARRMQHETGVLYFLGPMLSGNLLGAMLTLANVPVYQTYQEAPRTLDISALQDQQLGGLLMWIPGGMLWAIPLVVTLALFLRDEEETVISAGKGM